MIIFPLRLLSRIPLLVRALDHISLFPHTAILPYYVLSNAVLTGMQLLTASLKRPSNDASDDLGR